MKDLIKIIFMFIIVLIVYIYRNNISSFIYDEIIYKNSNKVLTYNEYYKNSNYLFVQNIDSTETNNYQEVLNMFYSIINSGDNSFTFTCNYEKCISDVKKLVDNSIIIADINNFVNPYNSFSNINVELSNNDVTVKISKVYTKEEIEYIQAYINNFIENNINTSMSDYDKIKTFHDYVINTTIYDNNKDSYTAYDLITTGKSICGGYSDIMAIYLNSLNIENYKITSSNHIWNLVNSDKGWLHIDATWDDPVASDGNQYLIHNFFMITTDQLESIDKIDHNFDKNIYLEAK